MPENPNCSRTWATFRIWGKLLNPHEVSARLGIGPSSAFQRGDARGRQGIWEHGYWELTSQDHVQSTDLQRHIEWLLDQLEPVQSEITTILEEQHLRADVFCFWESATGNGGPEFTAVFLHRFSALHVDLGLDIYCTDSLGEGPEISAP